MKASDRIVLLTIPFIALVVAYWMLVLGPKRNEASDLSGKITQLHTEVDQQRQVVAFGEKAKKDFPRDYQRFVVLGKAAPEDSEAASLLVQLTKIADDADVSFEALDLQEATGETAPAAPAPTSGEPSVTEAPGENSTPAEPTEAAAASLPIGATVGSAGLGVMPYKLTFRGDFFKVADFIADFDELVDMKKNTIAVDGRLLTVDGFSLTQDQARGFPHLEAEFAVTAYLSPSLSSLVAGGTTPGSTAAPAETAGTPTGGETP